MNAVCDICGDPAGDTAYVCTRCTSKTTRSLTDVINLAAEVETTVARQARYATRGGHRAQPVDNVRRDDPVNRRMPVPAFGWPASKERPARNALRPTALPVDLNASMRAGAAFNTVITWARHVSEERGVTIPDLQPGQHPAAVAAAFLTEHLEWLRHRPEAAEALDDLAATGPVIRRIVDAPPEMVIVGACDCGEPLYEETGRTTTTCQAEGCGLQWDVETSRDILRAHLAETLMTAAEAATLAAFLHPTGDREKIRKLITVWAGRKLITPHGVDRDGNPTYRFGDIISRIASSGTSPRGNRSATVAAI